MFRCPQCGGRAKSVRKYKGAKANRRRRRCVKCGLSFKTVEEIVPDGHRVLGLDVTPDVATAVAARADEDGAITITGVAQVTWENAQERCRYCRELGRPRKSKDGVWLHAHAAWAPDLYECEVPDIHEALSAPPASGQ